MLLQKEKTSVVIFNMQFELIPLLQNGSQLLNDCRWLTDICRDLQVPLMIVQHEKLGKLPETLTEIAHGASLVEKAYFDFMEEQQVARAIEGGKEQHYVLAGAETHVCLLQSAFRLKALGKDVFLLADTCSARSESDHKVALERIRQSGVQLITREMFFFELIRHSNYSNYINLAMKYLDGRYIR